LAENFYLGDWYIEPRRLSVSRAGASVTVKPRSMAVLVELARADGQVVERRHLLNSVWKTATVTDDVLTQSIVELRRALGDDARNARYIETIKRVGFRLIPQVSDSPPEGSVVGRHPEGIASIGHGPDIARAKLAPIAVGVLLLAVASILIDRHLFGDREPAPAEATSQSEETSSRTTIAVLPFVDMSPDADQEFFADGLSEEMMNQLAQIDGLLVTARTSSFTFKDRTEDIQSIGEQLGVAYALEGSVRKSGDRVRIVAQLVDTANGFHMWSQTYDRSLEDIFAIQEDIARQIAGELRLTFGLESGERLAGGTDDMVAYEHYLFGQSLMRWGAFGDPDSINEAIDEFEQAIALDPYFGLARVALAGALGTYAADPTPENIARRDRAILEAVEFAPELPGTQLRLAEQHLSRWEWSETDVALRRLLGLSPAGDFDANSGYGHFLLRTGRAQEALPYLQIARRAEPFATIEVGLSLAYDMLGDIDQAVVHYENSKTLFGLAPSTTTHLYRLVASDAIDDARRLFSTPPAMSDPNEALFRTAVRLLDDPPAARDALRALNEDPAYWRYPVTDQLANWAAHFAEPELAVTALRRAADQPQQLHFLWVWTPLWKGVRSHAAFKSFILDTGLVEYWKEYGWPEHCGPVGSDDFECH
jgi:TolB-like protein/DNA-binding winged helix-turn-helix (wHTH) protein